MAITHSNDELDRRVHRRRGAAYLASRRYQDGVEELMAAHVPLARVEDSIDAINISEEAKKALWLLAWSLDEPEPVRVGAMA